ncbi:MAG TPA: serine/threonine-protein kinase [Kofleriaceae bacterium]|nr:serine/threonine-protein kinase [Kofleriaceae bacterium]
MYAAEPSTPLGRYRLIALLGQGGMADVYLACTQGPRGFQKLLVVKLARFTGDPVLATMFLEEARIAAQLEHPNVVQTFEIADDGTRHYIVMEYLDGANLSRLRQRSVKSGGIPLRMSLTILMHVLEGLEYAHEARGLDGRPLNVVHRDLSPSNIMVTAQGVVKILDFGIAKATDSYSFTQTGKFSGKLSYMPPEQMRGHTVDARADLFAFGVTLAESALHEKLWGSTSGAEIAAKLGNNEIPSLDRATPLDPMLRAICERALAPDRDQRYATAAELKIDLAKYLEMIGGPVTQRELAQFVKTTVEDDRTKLQSIVDSQIQKLNAQGWVSTTPIPDLPRVEHTPSKDSTIQSGDPVFEDIQIIAEPAPPPVIPKAPARRGTGKLLALAGVLLALMIAFVVVWQWPKPAPVEITPAPSPAPAPVATTLHLEIVASPANATIMLDGKRLGANPYLGAFARDAKVHQLAISAPGYRPLTHEFAADRDLNLQLNLAPEPPAPPPPPHPIAITRPPVSHVTAKKSKPTVRAEAKVESKPPPELAKPDPVTQKAATQKRGVDTDIYATPPAKRSLDSNVLDGSGTSKPALDRDNPWQR